MSEDFYTLKGYARQENADLTHAMEDYLEMAARLDRQGQAVRIGELSRLLHVRPSSASKMVQQLVRAGLLQAPRYGSVMLTDRGRAEGQYLLYRHETVLRFLCTLNGTEDELEQAEKIEHFLTPATVGNLERLTGMMERQNG